MKYKNINIRTYPYSNSPSMPSKQNGVALLGVVIMLLLVIGLLSITSAKNTVLETRMVFNLQDKQRSFVAADSAVLYGLQQVNENFDLKKVVNNQNEAGYYAIGDKIVTSAKSATAWKDNKNVMTWPWEDQGKRFQIPTQLGGADNPMKLLSNPQYAIGYHNLIPRKGSSNSYCMPVSIIGASQGGTPQTRTLIEVKVIPKNTCRKEVIK